FVHLPQQPQSVKIKPECATYWLKHGKTPNPPRISAVFCSKRTPIGKPLPILNCPAKSWTRRRGFTTTGRGKPNTVENQGPIIIKAIPKLKGKESMLNRCINWTELVK
ncbi:MAG: hypothetical protein LBT33_07075, partial [Spirochaetia bacterium]|nr:hypothetical protein [Spirochaetia bacterium]